jgi:hypothetical protein
MPLIAASAKRAPFMMLFRWGNRKKSTHHTPLIWHPQAQTNKVNLCVSSVLFVFWYHSLNFLDTSRKL